MVDQVGLSFLWFDSHLPCSTTLSPTVSLPLFLPLSLLLSLPLPRWTWHNEEPLYQVSLCDPPTTPLLPSTTLASTTFPYLQDRLLGVPMASTFWVASTVLSLSLVVRGTVCLTRSTC